MSSRQSHQKLTYLWMDDEIDAIRNYSRVLGKDRPDVAFDFAESIPEAWSKLQTSGKYIGFVADCRMSKHDESANGAAMLVELNDRSKAFPTFVYSAFLDEPRYADPIRQSYALAVGSKADTFVSPLSADPFFATMLSAGSEYAAVSRFEPEKIEFRDYERSPEKYREHVAAHWRKHRRWIQRDMQRSRAAWVIVCGEQIVDASTDMIDFPADDEIAARGEENNLIPFAYSIVSLPEDVPAPTRAMWKNTTVKGDHYPCINARVADIDLCEDFDTGAAQTFVSDAVVRPGKWNFWAEAETPHLGKPFEYLPKKVNVTVIGDDGVTQTRPLSVLVVRDWAESSFTVFNPKRRVLFGRDLLRVFEVEVTLHARDRQTSVRVLP